MLIGYKLPRPLEPALGPSARALLALALAALVGVASPTLAGPAAGAATSGEKSEFAATPT